MVETGDFNSVRAKVTGKNTREFQFMKDGKEIRMRRMVVSEDGKTMQTTVTGPMPWASRSRASTSSTSSDVKREALSDSPRLLGIIFTKMPSGSVFPPSTWTTPSRTNPRNIPPVLEPGTRLASGSGGVEDFVWIGVALSGAGAAAREPAAASCRGPWPDWPGGRPLYSYAAAHGRSQRHPAVAMRFFASCHRGFGSGELTLYFP